MNFCTFTESTTSTELKQHLTLSSISIVLVGDFNPIIIQPLWLSSKGLIREEDETNAQIEYLVPHAVKFKLSWAEFEITTSRFSASTTQESCFEALRDLVLGIFRLLKETPIRSLGINHMYIYSLPNKEIYYNVGNKLAPLSNWSDFLTDPKMLQLEIIEQKRNDSFDGYYRVNIQPADTSLSIPFGVALNINDHVTVKKDELGRKGELLIYLRDFWQKSIERAQNIPEKIWEKIQD